jgi:hypothetical protein
MAGSSVARVGRRRRGDVPGPTLHEGIQCARASVDEKVRTGQPAAAIGGQKGGYLGHFRRFPVAPQRHLRHQRIRGQTHAAGDRVADDTRTGRHHRARGADIGPDPAGCQLLREPLGVGDQRMLGGEVLRQRALDSYEKMASQFQLTSETLPNYEEKVLAGDRLACATLW